MTGDSDNSANLVTYAEAARRVVIDGFAKSMSRQRMRQLHRMDPDFPDPVVRAPHIVLFNWDQELRPYFQARDSSPGRHKGWTA